MLLITTRSLIQNVAKRWEEQYKPYNSIGAEGILNKLRSLDLSIVNKEIVNGIIGNSSWTDLRCDECNEIVDCVVQMGEYSDYESATANVCVKCLKAAVRLCK